MALTKAYCTLAAVQADTRNASAPTADLEAGIHAASRWIDEYMGRDYLFHDHAATPLVLWGHNRLVSERRVLLPFLPIITLTAVVVNSQAWVEDVDFVKDPLGLLAIDGDFPVGDSDKIEVTGTFGYPETGVATGVFAVPSHIERACVQIASALSGHLRKDVVGLDGQLTSVTDRDIPASAKTLLGKPVLRT